MTSLALGYDANGRPIRLDPDDRKIHMHVIGSSGSGKSKFLEWMIRGDLRNHQGFTLLDPHGTLYNDVVSYCAHHPATLPQNVILLNLSAPTSIIGFNPFQRASTGSVSVQVDRRIAATMHAWGVEGTDKTPTLERTLRLIYTVMLDRNLGLPQVQHLIDFNARQIRGHLVDQLQTPLIQAEWRELQELKAREWRDEILSAKNRLFRFLTSPALTRFMGLPDRTLDLRAVMDEGKIVLVNLAPSDELSEENARVFGALLVNEFFECARRRQKDGFGRDPKPYYLYMDEFQNFVSLDIADMLDQVRKFGLFTVLAHQRFGHLDENITDAVLTNCRIKAVFGGLPASSARMMAEELFIRELDAKKIKAAIYQTKFWPKYSRDKVYTQATSHTDSSGYSQGTVSSLMSGANSGEFFGPADWFASSPSGSSVGRSTSTAYSSSSGSSSAESYGESEAVADVPIFIPVPFQELSSVQYYTHEEQLTELTAALKEQYPRHCFIKIHSEQTQAMLVPQVETLHTASKDIRWYQDKRLSENRALPAIDVDALIAAQETALLQAVQDKLDDRDTRLRLEPPDTAVAADRLKRGTQAPIWGRIDSKSTTAGDVKPSPRRQRTPGPTPDIQSYSKVLRIVSAYGNTWTNDENLMEICEQLDGEHVPVPKTWPTHSKHPATRWLPALQYHRVELKKSIRYYCKVAKAKSTLVEL